MAGPMKTKTAKTDASTCKKDQFKTQSQKDSRVTRKALTFTPKSDT